MKGSPVSMLIMVPGSMSVVDLYGGVAHIGGAVNASSVTLDRTNGLDMYLLSILQAALRLHGVKTPDPPRGSLVSNTSPLFTESY